MAQLDVTELMTDPDFVDPMTLITRTASTNLHGENIVSDCPVETFGCVQPANSEVINRLPDELRVANIKSFWLKGTIIASAPGKYASSILYKGQRYEVQHVFDWSNFGQGYCEGVCTVGKPT